LAQDSAEKKEWDLAAAKALELDFESVVVKDEYLESRKVKYLALVLVQSRENMSELKLVGE